MPVPISPTRGAPVGGGNSDTQRLENEIRVLRQEIESLRKQAGSEGGSSASAMMGWATMALAVLGVLLGLWAVFRHG